MRPVDVLIVTAIAVEREAVRSHLKDLTSTRAGSTAVDVGTYPTESGSLRVAVIESGPGNVQAGAVSAAPLQLLAPKAVMMVGIAGSLKDLEVGDVVASNKIYWVEPGKAMSVTDDQGGSRSEIRRRPDIGTVTERLVQTSRLVVADADWRGLPGGGMARRLDGSEAQAFVAPTVASELLVADLRPPEVQEIREHFSDAVAVAMEDYGVARAVGQLDGTAFLSIRAASDKCGDKATADAQGSHPLAAANAAAFAFAVVERDRRLGQSDGDRIEPATVDRSGSRAAGNRMSDVATVLADLYPTGPTHNEVWAEAGGDVSRLTLEGHGRARWVSALRLLERGGGGPGIDLRSLLMAARREFPHSDELEWVFEEFFGGGEAH